MTVTQRTQLESFDSLIPVAPDSVIAMYNQFPPEKFYARYGRQIDFVTALIDSFNNTVGPRHAIDTLCIEHALEYFADAGQSGHTLMISSSYFFLFDDRYVLRSVLTHEFGHVHYRMLDSVALRLADRLWTQVQEAALFYLFREGEYSGNAWFGGHPQDNPSELYASAYNLVRNNPEELRVRFGYVDTLHTSLLKQVVDLVTQR